METLEKRKVYAPKNNDHTLRFYDTLELLNKTPIMSNPDDNRPIIVSFSGGKSSALMCWILQTHPAYAHREKYYVFANTGAELPQTIKFVYDCDKEFGLNLTKIEAKVFHDQTKSSGHEIKDFIRLSNDNEPFIEVVKKYGFPSVATPHCTRELKINPIHSFIKNELDLKRRELVQAIGMRADEPERLKDPRAIYVLNEFGITSEMVQTFWNNMPFTLELEHFEGNCDFCYKKSDSSLIKMYQKYPTRFMKWMNMDNTFYEGKKETQIFRKNRDSSDIFAMFLENRKSVDDTEKFECTCTSSLLDYDYE